MFGEAWGLFIFSRVYFCGRTYFGYVGGMNKD